MHFRYTLNAFQVSPTKRNPFLHFACRPITYTLLTPERLIRHPVKLTAPILFECEAEGILEADQKFKAETGIQASRRPDVGCSIT